MTGQEAVDAVVRLHGSTKFGITGPDWGECTAVPHSLQREVLPDPYDIVYGNAKDIFYNAPDSLYIKVGPGETLLPGDIISEGGDPVLGTDARYGHTFIVAAQSNPGQAIYGYSQNYPTGGVPQYRWFPRNGLIGAIRAKVLQSSQGGPVAQTREEEVGALRAMLVGVQVQVQTLAAKALNADDTRNLLVGWYNIVLGRQFRGVGINMDLEIEPRVQSIINLQTKPIDHWNQIVASPEAKAWFDSFGKADTTNATKLHAAKDLAIQAKESLDKINIL